MTFIDEFLPYIGIAIVLSKRFVFLIPFLSLPKSKTIF